MALPLQLCQCHFRMTQSPATGPGVTANGGVQGVCLGPWGVGSECGRDTWDPGRCEWVQEVNIPVCLAAEALHVICL